MSSTIRETTKMRLAALKMLSANHVAISEIPPRPNKKEMNDTTTSVMTQLINSSQQYISFSLFAGAMKSELLTE